MTNETQSPENSESGQLPIEQCYALGFSFLIIHLINYNYVRRL